MSKSKVIGTRVDSEISNWLREKALAKNCTINDVVREAILTYKQFEELPARMQFSELILTQGAKSAMMAYRLLEKFVHTLDDGKKLVLSATEFTKAEFEEFKIQSTELNK